MRNIKLSKNLPKIEVKGTNEIWQLAGYYNEMAETLERQYKEIRRYYREKNLSIRQKNKAEKEALESQINAHFLCNTLTAINYNAIDNEDYEVADLLKKLYQYAFIYILKEACVSKSGAGTEMGRAVSISAEVQAYGCV